jgi:tRNA nucleotidyltransferase (CCA-adding enzyme)
VKPPLDRIDLVLAEALPPGSLFAVGGRVRDELRAEIEGVELPHKDFDYVVTGLPLAELQARLSRIGQVDLVGASFSVIKLTVDGRTVDVALPRRERSIGPGHRDFEVSSGPGVTLEEDLGRRDFRMNMIARSLPSGDLIDPFDGIADIRARRIDILTSRAFAEDPLRMLRAAQFAARFEYAVSESARRVMHEAAAEVVTLSRERIRDELAKLLERAARPSIGLELLRETGILEHLWPELLEGVGVEQNDWHAYDVWHHALATADAAQPGDLTLRLAALLHDVAKPRTKQGPHFYRHETLGAQMARQMLERFRFSNETIDAVAHLVRQHMYVADPTLGDPAVRRFIRRIRPEYLEHLFALRHADIRGSGLPKRDGSNERFEARIWEEIARKPAFSVRDLAIGGAEVIAALIRRQEAPASFRGDARVGDALRWLFERVTDAPERNERAVLLGLLEEYLDARRASTSGSIP